jgi:hypothetical protein
VRLLGETSVQEERISGAKALCSRSLMAGVFQEQREGQHGKREGNGGVIRESRELGPMWPSWSL